MTDPLGDDIKLQGDFILSTTGDLQIVSGTDNLRQRVIHWMQTVNDLYYFGNFGGSVPTLVDYAAGDTTDKIKQAITAALSQETDIADIQSLNVQINSDNTVTIDLTAEAVSGETVTVQTTLEGGA